MTTYLLDVNLLLALSDPMHIHHDALITHAQVTDVFLLGLAGHKHGKLATLDQHLPVMAVQGGAAALDVTINGMGE